ncbi:MAG: restriction endonuclease [Verrucomicrobiota bacterium]
MNPDDTKSNPLGKSQAPCSDGQNFIERIKLVCDNWHFDFAQLEYEKGPQLRIHFWPHSPMWIRIDIDAQTNSSLLVGVVRVYDVPHERTDYNELISLIWAAHLRLSNTASVRLLDIPHPVIPNEIKGRYVLFEKQPPVSFISLDHPDYDLIEEILVQSSLAAWAFSVLYQVSEGNPNEESCIDDDKWAQKVRRATRWKYDRTYEIWNARNSPSWSFYRRHDLGVSLFWLKASLSLMHATQNAADKELVLDAPDGFLTKTGVIQNCIANKDLIRLKKLLKIYGVSLGDFSSLRQGDKYLLLPTESHLICFTQQGLIAIDSEGGHDEYLRMESKLMERHQKEAKIFHSTVYFDWRVKVDDDRFEALTLDLLNREPGVRWARRIGTSHAPDGERDIIAEWLLRPALWESSTDSQVLTLKRVVVQCKVYSGSINRSKVGDVVGTVDLHNANGYLLVAYPQITPSLITYLETVPPKRKVCADWWTRTEIEDKLRKNLDIDSRYQDIVGIRNPST